MNREDPRKSIVAELEASLDARICDSGWRRSPKSLEYKRGTPDVEQVLNVSVIRSPGYKPDASAHVYPRIRIDSKSLSTVALRLVSDQSILLANEPEIVLNRPFEHLVPPVSRVQWFVGEAKSPCEIVREIADQFAMWGLPFMDSYRTIDDLIQGYERGDERIRFQRTWPIFAASAYVLKGSAREAERIVRNQYSTPKEQRKYNVVLKNLRDLLESG